MKYKKDQDKEAYIDFCHRHLVAGWLNSGTENTIEEWNAQKRLHNRQKYNFI